MHKKTQKVQSCTHTVVHLTKDGTASLTGRCQRMRHSGCIAQRQTDKVGSGPPDLGCHGLLSQARPFPSHSVNRFQYPRAEERNGPGVGDQPRQNFAKRLPPQKTTNLCTHVVSQSDREPTVPQRGRVRAHHNAKTTRQLSFGNLVHQKMKWFMYMRMRSYNEADTVCGTVQCKQEKTDTVKLPCSSTSV